MFPGEEAMAAEPGVRIRHAWAYGAMLAVGRTDPGERPPEPLLAKIRAAGEVLSVDAFDL